MADFVGIIPARSGSKRVPGKNTIDFNGKPMIAWTIEAALNSIISRVIVSSDDPYVYDICKKYNVEYHSRSPESSTDSARLIDVVNEVAANYSLADTQLTCLMLATSPLRQAEHINSVLKPLLKDQTLCSVAMTTYDLPVHQSVTLDADGFGQPVFPELINLRADHAPQYFCDNGSTYAFLLSNLRKHQSFFFPPLVPTIMPKDISTDIDTPLDLLIARAVSQHHA